jgi:L-galactose dehydrogenase
MGFGASPLGEVFGPVKQDEINRSVHLAIDRGINYFDVAPYYGKTLAEERLGEALAGRRQQVVLATKTGRYGLDEFDFSARGTALSIEQSLRRLRTDYVDLLQVHDIEFGDVQQILDETLPAMRKIQEQGKARYIGATGLCLKPLVRVAESFPVDSILSYCRYNLLITDMDEILTPVARERKIGLINASPLHMGVLTAGGGPAWHPAPPEVHAEARSAVEFCRQRGVDLAALALRFALDHPYVTTTLVGISTTKQVEANLNVLCEETDPELLTQVQAMLAPVSGRTWHSGREENND